MLAGLAQASPFYFWPLAGGIFLGCVQIVAFFVGDIPGGHGILDAAEGTGIGEAFDWLNVGRVPFSILLMLLLVTFGAVGLTLSGFVPALPDWVFAFAAAPAALGVAKVGGDGIARVLPKDETYAVASEDLLGLQGTVTLGPLDDGHPGNVVVKDRHGETHVLRARPVDRGTSIDRGEPVVIVERVPGPGRVFFVMPFGTE